MVSSLELPLYSGFSKLLVKLLGLREAEKYYGDLPTVEGLAACANHILVDCGFDLEAIQTAAQRIPQHGALLVTSNHPTGILDGVVLLAALLGRRGDVRIVANQILSRIPVVADCLIPVEKSYVTHRQNRQVLLAIRQAWNHGECVIVFPAGTVAHWQWREMQIADAPWNDSILRFAAKRCVPEYRANLLMRNPNWFHGCAAVSRKARTALLLRAFFSNHTVEPKNFLTFDSVSSSVGVEDLP